MTSMSPMWRMTWFDSRIPLPPSRSRASAITQRAVRELLSFASPAIVSESRLDSSSGPIVHAVELADACCRRLSRAPDIWYATSGVPNHALQ